MKTHYLATIAAIAVTGALMAAPARTPVPQQPLPRTADGKPNLDGIWQASSTAEADLEDHAARYNMPAGRSVVTGGTIPYQPWAAGKKAENFQNRQKDDPLAQCYMPGVPRIMYLDFPFQIFQTTQAIAIAFEWSLDYRLIYTDGSPHTTNDIDSWMGDSRGRWEGDTLVVDVTKNNDKTWFDMAGDFHSEALHVVERYRMTGPDTIQYDATIEDAKVFTKPWTISIALHRRTDRDRLFEYNGCQSEAEEVSGAFTREDRTWPRSLIPGSRAACRHLPAIANFPARARDSGESRGEYPPDHRRQAGPAGLLRRHHRRREPGTGKTRRHRACSGRKRHNRRSPGRDTSHAALGLSGKGLEEPARTWLRRSDSALFPARRAAIDVCPGGISHHPKTRLRRLSA